MNIPTAPAPTNEDLQLLAEAGFAAVAAGTFRRTIPGEPFEYTDPSTGVTTGVLRGFKDQYVVYRWNMERTAFEWVAMLGGPSVYTAKWSGLPMPSAGAAYAYAEVAGWSS